MNETWPPNGNYFTNSTYLDTIALTGLRNRTYSGALKHYYAAGTRLASRINDGTDDILYYVQTDPNGQYSFYTDSAGAEVGYLLTTPFGEVISSTLSASLTLGSPGYPNL